MKRLTVLILGLLLLAPTGFAQGIITTVAGNGTPGFSGDGGSATSAQLGYYPWGLAVDAAGDLYISDTNNMRVRKVNAAGVITTVAGNGQGDFTGETGRATQESLWFPSGVAVDSAGNLFISDGDNNRVRKVTPSGMMTTVAGGGPCCSVGDGGPATRATLKGPTGLAVDAEGNVYIADAGHYRIRKVTPHGTITTVAGYGGWGSYGDGLLALSSPLSSQIWQVAVDSGGNVYVAGYYDLRKVNTAGIITTVADGFQGGYSVAVGPAGSVYFWAGQAVYKLAGGTITRVAGGGTAQSDGIPATNFRLDWVRALAVDAAGNLYIATTARVYKVTP